MQTLTYNDDKILANTYDESPKASPNIHNLQTQAVVAVMISISRVLQIHHTNLTHHEAEYKQVRIRISSATSTTSRVVSNKDIVVHGYSNYQSTHDS